MRLLSALRAIAVTLAISPFASSYAQELTSSTPGRLGYKTVEHKRREGNTPATEGNFSEYRMVFGGFADRCPQLEPVKYSGVVLGRQQGQVDAEQSVVAPRGADPSRPQTDRGELVVQEGQAGAVMTNLDNPA